MEYGNDWNNHTLVLNTLGFSKYPDAINIHGYVPKVPIVDFKTKGGLLIRNKARTIDVSERDIAEWTILCEEGKYDDKIHCPPTFTTNLGKKHLNTGTCKTKGADGAGWKTIGAVHVSYNDAYGIPSSEWEEIARSNENRPLKDRDDFIKNDRKEIDILGTLVNLYSKGNIKLSKTNKDGDDVPYDTDVNKRLDALFIPPSKQPIWRAKLYTRLDINTDRIVSTIADNKKDIAKFKKNVLNLYNGKKIMFKTLESGENTKYGIELSRKVLDARLEKNPYDIIVVKLTGIHTPETLFKTREKIRNFFTDENQEFQKDLKRKESKIKKSESWPKIYFEPQTEEEKINWNKKKEKLL